ncbi:hypothetical protein MNBD_UNCLBAC01-1907 [hydrothermal vent metagenome]|uniref:Putative zinc-finger domain-containing protein n=1 Tax=hydrothermal vent metagenome TaxID=652676 RepID=A0A3B1CY57_9ZZZZ
MSCCDIQKLLPLYLDEALNIKETQGVKAHVKECLACQKELHAYQASWDMLGELEEVEPRSDYVSRFWTNVAQQKAKSWYVKVWEDFKCGFLESRFVPVVVTACIVMIVSVVSLRNYKQFQSDLEMMDYIELAENLEVIEDFEVWEDWEVIEYLDKLNV